MFVFPRLGCFIRTTGWGCAPCLSCAENNDPSKPLKSPPFPAPPNAHDRARGRAGRKGGEGGGGRAPLDGRRPTATQTTPCSPVYTLGSFALLHVSVGGAAMPTTWSAAGPAPSASRGPPSSS